MDSIADRSDGHFLKRRLRPQIFPHAARDLAVKLAYAVDARSQANGQDSHGEIPIWLMGCLLPQSQELFSTQTQFLIVAGEIVVYKLGRKHVDACWHRRVGCENCAA